MITHETMAQDQTARNLAKALVESDLPYYVRWARPLALVIHLHDFRLSSDDEQTGYSRYLGIGPDGAVCGYSLPHGDGRNNDLETHLTAIAGFIANPGDRPPGLDIYALPDYHQNMLNLTDEDCQELIRDLISQSPVVRRGVVFHAGEANIRNNTLAASGRLQKARA